MQILERAAAVALDGVILAYDIVIFVVYILLLVVVAVLIFVGRRRIDGTCRELPLLITIGEAQELIKSLERAYTLHILQAEALVLRRLGR